MQIDVLYFTGPDCGVCQVLKPKLLGAIREQFPEVKIRVIDITVEREFAAQHMVFTLPVLTIEVDGQESYRFARSFSVFQVLQKLERIVQLSGEDD